MNINIVVTRSELGTHKFSISHSLLKGPTDKGANIFLQIIIKKSKVY